MSLINAIKEQTTFIFGLLCKISNVFKINCLVLEKQKKKDLWICFKVMWRKLVKQASIGKGKKEKEKIR